jgi:glycerol-3-phosphate dehydrogenase
MGRALTFPRTEDPSPALANSVGATNLAGDRTAVGVARRATAASQGGGDRRGSWGTAVAVLLARGGLDVQLGTRTGERAEEMNETRTNEDYLSGIELPRLAPGQAGGGHRARRIDLVCLAVPSAALPQAVGSIGDRVGQRASVLLLSKGMVAPMAALPSEYVSERIRARAIASLGGPAHAKEAVSGTAALVLGSRDPDLRDQLGSVFDEAGLVCERSEDMIGVEVAGAAKNAAALAGAAAQAQGMNAAGIATAQVWRECVAYARARGAEHETFAGIAGVGDLTATILAEGSRNRRAGELLGQGTPAEQIPGIIGQASEALDSVPLIAEAVRKSGWVARRWTAGGLIASEISPASGWPVSGRPSVRGESPRLEARRHEANRE